MPEIKSVTSDDANQNAAIRSGPQKCLFCGEGPHNRQHCPAREANCVKCGKKGHYARVCRSSSQRSNNKFFAFTSVLSHVSQLSSSLHSAVMEISINGHPCKALFDSGSTESYVDFDFIKLHRIPSLDTHQTLFWPLLPHLSKQLVIFIVHLQ